METNIKLSNEELNALKNSSWIQLIDLYKMILDYEEYNFEDNISVSTKDEFKNLFSAYSKLYQFSDEMKKIALNTIKDTAKRYRNNRLYQAN